MITTPNEQAELRSHHAMDQQLAPRHRRRKQELQLRLGELEQAAVDRQQPAGRRRPANSDHASRRRWASSAQSIGGTTDAAVSAPRGRRRATPDTAQAREDGEVEVRDADDRADQVARLAQPAQPHAQAVLRAVQTMM